LVLLRMLDPTSLFCALAQSAGRNGVSCWLHVRPQQSTFFSTPAPESERNLTGYLQLCSRPPPQDILVRSWRRECSDVPLCSRFPTFYISRPACSISQGSQLGLHRPDLARKASSPNNRPSEVGSLLGKPPVYSFWSRRVWNV
jgi:hypothetical protein